MRRNSRAGCQKAKRHEVKSVLTDVSLKIIQQLIRQTIAGWADDHQMLDVISLMHRLEEMAENESDEALLLCYWQASKVLMRLPPKVTVAELLAAARDAVRETTLRGPL